jgi:hypothetical protein
MLQANVKQSRRHPVHTLPIPETMSDVNGKVGLKRSEIRSHTFLSQCPALRLNVLSIRSPLSSWKILLFRVPSVLSKANYVQNEMFAARNYNC